MLALLLFTVCCVSTAAEVEDHLIQLLGRLFSTGYTRYIDTAEEALTLHRGHGPGKPSPPGRRPGPGDRPGSVGERRARALGPRPALPRRSPCPLAPPGGQSSSDEGMAPASHHPRGGARGQGTGRGASGKDGPGPSAHGPPFPGAPRASWRPKFLRRGHGPGEPSPGKGPTKGQQGHRMSKGQQGPKGKQDLEDYIERQAKKGGCICFEYVFRGGAAGTEEANIYALQSTYMSMLFREGERG